MEVPMDLSLIFKEAPIQRLDQGQLSRLTPQRYPVLCKSIDKIGQLSAKTQNLRKPLTTYEKILDSNDGQILYIYWEKPETSAFSKIVGFLKIARKKLYLCNSDERQFIAEPVCVLDFYVDESSRHAGIAHQLFDKMLEMEQIDVSSVALDKPNEILLNFFHKFYNLDEPVWQSTNFVVFGAFFDGLTPQPSGTGYGADGCTAAKTQKKANDRANDRTCENSRASSPNHRVKQIDAVSDLIHHSELSTPREKYGEDTPRGRKNIRDFGHSNIFG